MRVIKCIEEPFDINGNYVASLIFCNLGERLICKMNIAARWTKSSIGENVLSPKLCVPVF